MRKVLIVLAILYTVVLSLNYILGVFNNPLGYTFLGTVHNTSDYFYYLSLFTQGKTNWVSPADLFTSEKTQKTLVGFTNVAAGHILSFFNIPAIGAYQLTVTIYTVVFFLLVIFFLEAVFPKEPEAQCIAFIFLCIANIIPGTSSFWSNSTEPMMRFTRVPHQMLGLICILLPMILLVKWQEQPRSRLSKSMMAIGMIGAGILLANINPVQWALVLFTMVAASLWKRSFRFLLLPAVFLIAGAPMILYLLRTFSTLPFIQLAQWESKIHIHLSLINFIESFGPVFILAVLGLPLLVRRMTAARVLILVYTVASVVLFLSPVSDYAHITNIRFLSAVTLLGESILAAYVLIRLPIANHTMRRILTWMVIIGLSAVCIPQYIQQFQRYAYLDIHDSYVYLSNDAVSAYHETQKITDDKDVVLATWPFDDSFPALTGRRGFMGHPLLTINSDKKIQEAYYFFDAKIDDAAMHTFLSDNHITYVLEFTSVTKIAKPFMQAVYRNPLLTLYKVLP